MALKHDIFVGLCIFLALKRDLFGGLNLFVALKLNPFLVAHLPWLEDSLGKGGLVQKVWEVLKGNVAIL